MALHLLINGLVEERQSSVVGEFKTIYSKNIKQILTNRYMFV